MPKPVKNEIDRKAIVKMIRERDPSSPDNVAKIRGIIFRNFSGDERAEWNALFNCALAEDAARAA